MSVLRGRRHRCVVCPFHTSWALDLWEHLTTSGHGRLA